MTIEQRPACRRCLSPVTILGLLLLTLTAWTFYLLQADLAVFNDPEGSAMQKWMTWLGVPLTSVLTIILAHASLSAFPAGPTELPPAPRAAAAPPSQTYVTSINPYTGATTTVPDGVTITGGHLVAPNGQAHIASVASRGEILVTNLHETGIINGHTFTTLGALQLSQQSSIDIRGDSGASIRIRGGHLVIDSSTLSSTAGQISVDTDSVHITNSSEVKTETTTAANAGHISLYSQRDITLDSDALIISSSRSTSGHAGDITLQSQLVLY